MRDYKFTNYWFEEGARGVWDKLIPKVMPRTILEVGSFEGASACYLIDKLTGSHDLELFCVDTWDGGIEHQLADFDMASVEARFRHNVGEAAKHAEHKVRIDIRKGQSDIQLARLLSEGKAGYFDFVYIDGSHQAPDVLCDAVLGFKLLKKGGVMVFDDYTWSEHAPADTDILRCPKIAVDAFVNIHFKKLQLLKAPLFQLYVKKLAD
ncbi:class I SAM-dependent methyltransferase [Kordiimonas gwangyangensis]|uniref:class I SAM-dependent methyltransferase n=1 Tax=Kordiimonas gwangyangensis TaxID=288022 RepID=UPI00036664F0|nr:class I SAM-dependent methyltransferase [Kordiimonas gwangyangensis]